MDIIANPIAGRGRGTRSIRRLKGCLDKDKVPYHVYQTESQGHAIELATHIARSGGNRIVVVGGDGTISEVVNGMVGSSLELGVVSVGTGNDFARSLGLPYNNIEASYQILRTGEGRDVDVGVDGNRHFVSALGVGFPAIVASETNKMEWLGGQAAFYFSVHKALHRMRPFPARLVLDEQVLEMDFTSILIQNTPFTGGGLKVAPEALVDDGFLDVVVVGAVGKLDLMLNFPRVYRGRHSAHPAFRVYKSRCVQVTSDVALEKMSDGDLSGVVPVEVKVLPRALKVILPVD